ncbi:hypothetical protein [Kribbella sp. C-35]|uniref:hypothetical protein n=1 Tax=Kribbella sp. C-35 TaxID=2789276 RepID=UPI00397BFE5C
MTEEDESWRWCAVPMAWRWRNADGGTMNVYWQDESVQRGHGSRIGWFLSSAFRLARWLLVPAGFGSRPQGYQLVYVVRSVLGLVVLFLVTRTYLGIPEAEELPVAVILAPEAQLGSIIVLTTLATMPLPRTRRG